MSAFDCVFVNQGLLVDGCATAGSRARTENPHPPHLETPFDDRGLVCTGMKRARDEGLDAAVSVAAPIPSPVTAIPWVASLGGAPVLVNAEPARHAEPAAAPARTGWLEQQTLGAGAPPTTAGPAPVQEVESMFISNPQEVASEPLVRPRKTQHLSCVTCRRRKVTPPHHRPGPWLHERP